jgi:hypothetical protein
MSNIIAASLLAISVSAAVADEVPFQPKEVTPAKVMDLGAQAIDVMGLKPGMTLDQARPKFLAVYPPLADSKVHFSAKRGPFTATTNDFVNRINGSQIINGKNDSMAAHFSGPASGNQLIAVSHSIWYMGSNNPLVKEY